MILPDVCDVQGEDGDAEEGDETKSQQPRDKKGKKFCRHQRYDVITLFSNKKQLTKNKYIFSYTYLAVSGSTNMRQLFLLLCCCCHGLQYTKVFSMFLTSISY